MKTAVIFIGVLLCPALFADRIVVSTGESFDGDFFGATSQEVRFVVDGKLMSFRTAEIVLIQFGPDATPQALAAAGPCPEPAAAQKAETTAAPPADAAPAPKPNPPAPAKTAARSASTAAADRPTLSRRRDDPEPRIEQQPDPIAESSGQPFSIRPGTHLLVRLEEEVDSERHQVGQTFRASLEKAIYTGDREAIPAGAEVVARLVSSRGEGASNKGSTLALDLVAIVLDGQHIDIVTDETTQAGESRETKGKVKEGLARAGSRLGTILGGSTVGTTTGETVEAATKGQALLIESGTVMDFVLRSTIERTAAPAGGTPSQAR